MRLQSTKKLVKPFIFHIPRKLLLRTLSVPNISQADVNTPINMIHRKNFRALRLLTVPERQHFK